MMRKLYIVKVVMAVLVVLPLVCSCYKGDLLETGVGVPEGEPVTITIPFSASDLLKVEVGTKSELKEDDEYRIYNIYVMLFDSDGNKFYGRLFSASDLVGARDLSTTSNECWTISNRNGSGTTLGQVKIATVSKPNCTVWMTTNLGLTGSNTSAAASAAKMNAVTSWAELQGQKLKLGEETLSRRGYLPMNGKLSPINTGNMADDVRLFLRRLDAKIIVRVRSNTENIQSFKLDSWKVYNLPADTYIIERDPVDLQAGSSASWDSQDHYFDTDAATFEGVEIENIDGEDVVWNVFSFYMFENRLVPQQAIPEGAGNYYLREKQTKTPDSTGGVDNGDWAYANLNSTYLTFNADMYFTEAGLRSMLEIPSEEPLTKIGLTTQCKYTIHLGDFTNCDQDKSHNYNDYNTFRNHVYTYNVVVNNAKEIYVEVKNHSESTEVEPQPSEIGRIVLAEKKIFNCDAHYENHIMGFDYMPSEEIAHYSWYVVTPFCEGFPENVSTDTESLQFAHSGLDDQWVQFMLNEEDATNGQYSENRQPYPPLADQPAVLMDVAQLVDFLYKEAKKWESTDPEVKHSSKFYDPVHDNLRTIQTTAFVNEYYYEEDPFTGERNPSLWRLFTDAPDRELHILSTSMRSKDKESSVIETHHSVVQRSIKSIYNENSPSLRSLWGAECKDEFADESWECGAGTSHAYEYYNGRFNSTDLWGLTSGTDTTWHNQNWNTYLNFEVPENTPQVNAAYKKIIYTCLARNRDNNGNGVIDRDEIRWYMPAIGQLNGLWLGNDALPYDVRLYFGHEGEVFHNISSSWSNNNQGADVDGKPLSVIWTEEGGSNSNLGQSYTLGIAYHYPSDPWKHYSTRCVRNVGTFTDESGSITDITYLPLNTEKSETDSFFEAVVEGSGRDAVMRFSFDNLNPKALRYYSNTELIAADQNSVQNRLYNTFETQPISTAYELPSSGISADNINAEITESGVNKYCAEGYRLPNQREVSIIALNYPDIFPNPPGYIENSLNGRAPTRTYYSYGEYGSKIAIAYDGSAGYKGYYLLEKDRDRLSDANYSQHYAKYMRCVRDVDASSNISIGLLISNGEQYSEVTTASPGSQVNVNVTVDTPYSDLAEIQYRWRYTNTDGQTTYADVFTQTFSESKRQFTSNMNVDMPASDNPIWADLDITKPVYVQAIALNQAGSTAMAESTMQIVALDCDLSYSAPNVVVNTPVNFSISAESLTTDNLHEMKIEYQKQGETTWTEVGSTGAKVTSGTWNPAFTADVSKQYNSGAPGTAPLTFTETGSYKVRLVCSDGYFTQASNEVDVEVSGTTIFFDRSGNQYYSQPEGFDVTTTGNYFQLPSIDWAAGDYFEVQMDAGTGGTPYILGGKSAFTGAPNYSNVYSLYMWSGSNELKVNNNGNNTKINSSNFKGLKITIRVEKGVVKYKIGDAANWTEYSDTTAVPFGFQNTTLADPLYFGWRSDSSANAHYDYIKIVRGGSSGPVAVTGVSLPATASVPVGGTITLTADVEPDDASIASYSWSCTPSDGSVVTLVDNGNGTATVTGVSSSLGTASITVTATDTGSHSETSSACVVTVTPPVAVTGVSLNKATTTIANGGYEQLIATVSPSDAANKNVTWSSDDTSVATVDADGTVHAVANGTATITVTTVDGGFTDTCDVTVTTPSASTTYYNKDGTTIANPVEGTNTGFTSTSNLDFNVEFSTAKGNPINWAAGDVLEAKITASAGDNKAATFGNGNDAFKEVYYDYTNGTSWWKFCTRNEAGGNDKNIDTNMPDSTTLYIRLSADGGLEHSANGSTWHTSLSSSDTTYLPSIMALGTSTPFYFGHYLTGGSVTYEYLKVTRNGGGSTIPVQSVSLNKNSTSIAVGSTETLTASITPANATDQAVTWNSDDTTVATVDADGTVHALAAGSATITVTTHDGNHTATCAVTVTGSTPVSGTVYYDKSGNEYSSPQTINVGASDTASNFKFALPSLNWAAGDYLEFQMIAPGVASNHKGNKLTIGEETPPSGGGGSCIEFFSGDGNQMYVYPNIWSYIIYGRPTSDSTVHTYRISKDGVQHSTDGGNTWEHTSTAAFDVIKNVSDLYVGIYGYTNNGDHTSTINYLKVVTSGGGDTDNVNPLVVDEGSNI